MNKMKQQSYGLKYRFVWFSIVCFLIAAPSGWPRAVAQDQSASTGQPAQVQAQLYLAAISFVSFTKGYLEKEKEPSKDGKAIIRECFTGKAIPIDKGKLTAIAGDCYSADSGPPWNPQRSAVGVIDGFTTDGSLKIRTADGKMIELTSDVWRKAFESASTEKSWAPFARPTPEVGDLVGGIKSGPMKSLYLIERQPLKNEFHG